MRRTLILLLIAFLSLAALPLAAQEEEQPDETDPDSPQIESDWDAYRPELYSRGDKTFSINLGVIFPTVFTGAGIDEGDGHNLGLGGTGSLAFNYYLNSHFFWGGELGGMFSGTRGENMFYAVPFGLRIGYQLVLGRFEFPVSLMVGAAPQKYLDKGYFGLIVKPALSGFFRFTPNWSFGINTQWWMLPQWPENGKNVFGNFLEITLAARYHFL